jgi:hypothetical protein
VDQANEALLKREPVAIKYESIDDLSLNAEMNIKALEQEVGEGANIYAIWSKESKADTWHVMYIGQRTKQFVLERINQHLFKTPKGTNSKIEHVKDLLQNGSQVGVSTILVEPDPLRLSVEVQLIFRNTDKSTQLPWNNKSRNVRLSAKDSSNVDHL